MSRREENCWRTAWNIHTQNGTLCLRSFSPPCGQVIYLNTYVLLFGDKLADKWQWLIKVISKHSQIELGMIKWIGLHWNRSTRLRESLVILAITESKLRYIACVIISLKLIRWAYFTRSNCLRGCSRKALCDGVSSPQLCYYITRAAVQVKFLIAINLAIKIINLS